MKRVLRALGVAALVLLVNALLARILCAAHVVERALALSPGAMVLTVLSIGCFLLLRLASVFVLPGWVLAETIAAVVAWREARRASPSAPVTERG